MLGTLRISRALPVKGRRMIGPWCFLDRFGPLSFTEGMPMDVAPHPHMGLQTSPRAGSFVCFPARLVRLARPNPVS
jgi:hypothetical protein